MSNTLKEILWGIMIAIVLAVLLFVWPVPQLIQTVVFKAIPAAPTRDPMIDALATSQALQVQGLNMIQTQLAQVKEPVVNDTPTPQLTPTLSAPIQPAAPAPVSGDLYRSPVQTTDVFNEESAWMIAEPGVILDDTAAWVIPSVNATHFANVPEGGFTYFSLGQGKIVVDGFTIGLPYQEGNNYLVLIRGRIDDGIVDKDLNETAEVTDFKPGHAIWSIMPPGAYVSKGWFMQQLVVSTSTGGTNCGATGCTTTHVVLFDVDSHTISVWEVKADALNNWTLVN